MTSAVQLCVGHVTHSRLRPVLNHFRYPVFFLRLTLTRKQDLAAASNSLFGFERARPISFRHRDHAARDGGDLLGWLDGRLRDAGIERPDGAVVLQCFPRVLGYAFKPVSFWFCHNQAGELKVLLAEVNNTFGERHQYVLVPPDDAPIGNGSELVCRKVFHVSPFCEVRGQYRFRVLRDGDRHTAVIDYFDDPNQNQPLIKTAMSGLARDAKAAALFACLLQMPLLGLGVVARIHWQALRLWIKGVRFYRKPAPPMTEMTHNIEGIR